MYSLTTIIELNKIDRKIAESETTRHCSYVGSVERGFVLHSAKLRSTVFVAGGPAAQKFARRMQGLRDPATRDRIIESYFN